MGSSWGPHRGRGRSAPPRAVHPAEAPACRAAGRGWLAAVPGESSRGSRSCLRPSLFIPAQGRGSAAGASPAQGQAGGGPGPALPACPRAGVRARPWVRVEGVGCVRAPPCLYLGAPRSSCHTTAVHSAAMAGSPVSARGATRQGLGLPGLPLTLTGPGGPLGPTQPSPGVPIPPWPSSRFLSWTSLLYFLLPWPSGSLSFLSGTLFSLPCARLHLGIFLSRGLPRRVPHPRRWFSVPLPEPCRTIPTRPRCPRASMWVPC